MSPASGKLGCRHSQPGRSRERRLASLDPTLNRRRSALGGRRSDQATCCLVPGCCGRWAMRRFTDPPRLLSIERQQRNMTSTTRNTHCLTWLEFPKQAGPRGSRSRGAAPCPEHADERPSRARRFRVTGGSATLQHFSHGLTQLVAERNGPAGEANWRSPELNGQAAAPS